MESSPGNTHLHPEADDSQSAELPFVPGLVAKVIEEDSRIVPTESSSEGRVLSPREVETLPVVRTLTDLVEQARQNDQESLTGLLNKSGFDKSLQHSIELLPGGFSLVLIDVDNFKTINDTQGHEAGDTVLREIATSLVASTREYDVLSLYPRDGEMPGNVARQGGDEFAVILPGVNDRVIMQRVVDRMVEDVKVNTGADISAAGAVHQKGQDAQALRELADTAQRLVKEERKIGSLSTDEKEKLIQLGNILNEMFPGRSFRELGPLIDTLHAQARDSTE